MKREIKLLQDAYICGPVDDPHYEASAIEPDGDPLSPEYTVYWTVKVEELEEMKEQYYDESNACDWDKFEVYKDGELIGDQDSVTVIDPQGYMLNKE